MKYILYAGCLYLLYAFFIVKKHGVGPSYETNSYNNQFILHATGYPSKKTDTVLYKFQE